MKSEGKSINAIIVSDIEGKILSVTKLADVGPNPSGIISVTVVPQKGQRIHQIALEPEFLKGSLINIHDSRTVEKTGRKVQLKRLK
jgi:hypothetical protein